MPVDPDIGRRQRQAGRGLRGAEQRQPLQRLRRGEFGADNCLPFLQDRDRHQAGLFLEQQPRGRLGRPRRQHEGGADIGMAGERDFGANGENPDLRVVGGVTRRQHEGGLGIVEFAGNRLHLRRRQPAGIQHHRERIAAKGAIGENVHRDIASLHLPSSLSQPPHRHRPVIAPDRDLAERHRIAAVFAQRVANGGRDQAVAN